MPKKSFSYAKMLHERNGPLYGIVLSDLGNGEIIKNVKLKTFIFKQDRSELITLPLICHIRARLLPGLANSLTVD